MTTQYIKIGKDGWYIIVYYNVSKRDFSNIKDILIQFGCKRYSIRKVLDTLRFKNTGLTFTNTEYKTSIVCISEATSQDLFISTAIHEIDHVQTHICKYYNVDLLSEEAAYLIGYIARKMYTALRIYV